MPGRAQRDLAMHLARTALDLVTALARRPEGAVVARTEVPAGRHEGCGTARGVRARRQKRGQLRDGVTCRRALGCEWGGAHNGPWAERVGGGRTDGEVAKREGEHR